MRAFSALLFSFCLLNVSAYSEELASLVKEIQYAKPIERSPPKYPMGAARHAREGWVQMSFVVDETGKVVDPIVLDSSGQKAFEKAALKAVKKWKYSPAKENGQAVLQCENRVQLDFRLHTSPKGVSRSFKNIYKKALEASRNKEVEQLEALLDELKGKHIRNMYEDAWYWMLHADLMAAKDDKLQQLQSIKRATSNDKAEYLGDDNYLMLLSQKFVLEWELENWQFVLKTYESIQKHPNGEETALAFRQYVDQVNELLNSGKALGTEGVVNERGSWSHPLTHHHFGLEQVAGQLDELDIRCDNKRHIYTATAGSAWSIPDSWENCWVHVKGTPNSTFELVEAAQLGNSESKPHQVQSGGE